MSIIIPCRNEENYILQCLDSVLLAASQLESFEVLIVDGMSEDGTRVLLKPYLDEYEYVTLIDNIHRTTPYAFNAGIAVAQGGVIQILGAHSIIAEDYLTVALEVLKADCDIGCVGGCSENVYSNKLARCIGLAMSSPFGVGNSYFRIGSSRRFVDTVGHPAFKREVFDEVGLFDERLVRNQDDDFSYRMRKTGYKILLVPELRRKYFVRSTYRSLWRQFYLYGYWKVFVNLKHRAVTSWRQIAPALLVILIVLATLTIMIGNWFGVIALLAILSSYSILSFAFACLGAEESRQVVPIMYAFFVLHFSYGFGYIRGLLVGVPNRHSWQS